MPEGIVEYFHHFVEKKIALGDFQITIKNPIHMPGKSIVAVEFANSPNLISELRNLKFKEYSDNGNEILLKNGNHDVAIYRHEYKAAIYRVVDFDKLHETVDKIKSILLKDFNLRTNQTPLIIRYNGTPFYKK
ncbi:hypothetical protein HY989_06720 [Candidatus Micrarchaeota archaeon]|nr:hypothetical protein [Candidatus Micrarchaeota archaeon]